MRRQYLLAAIALMSALAATACREEGPAERAGEKVDKAVDDAKDALEDATD